jgi:hypothetical protein
MADRCQFRNKVKRQQWARAVAQENVKTAADGKLVEQVKRGKKTEEQFLFFEMLGSGRRRRKSKPEDKCR